jgi:predicted nucleic acid-binding protein
MAKGEKTQIVLDADVVIHFSKGGLLSLLPRIFPDYEYVLLEAVHEELLSDIRTQIDNQMVLLKNITLLPFAPRGEMLREYAMLRSRFGKGESACMAYCLFTHNVIGSSNLRDIRTYCQEKQITYLTTMDFLWYAWRKQMMTTDELKTFINEVKQKGSKLPDVEIEKYVCKTIL